MQLEPSPSPARRPWAIGVSIAALWLGSWARPAEAANRLLYGIAHLGRDVPSILYRIDPADGTTVEIGEIDFERISAMALSPGGVMYATGERSDGSDLSVLLTVDLVTAAGTEVGLTGLEGFHGVFPNRRVISDFAFRDSDGTLYAYAFPGGSLATMDLGSGAGTQLTGPTFPGTGFFNGGGLAFTLDGTLYHGGDEGNMPGQGGPGLQQLDPATSVVLGEIPLLFPPDFEGTDPRPNGMSTHPDTGVIYSLLKANFMEDDTYFGLIDPGTGEVTVVGETADGLAALSWGPPDDDLDGFPDAVDACPDSDTGLTVVVGDCDSGVANALLDDGCTISDLVAGCGAGAGNHGAFVSCVAHLADELKSAGVITGAEKGQIMACAASCG